MNKYLALLCSTKNYNSADVQAMKRLNEIYQELKSNSSISTSSAKKLAFEALQLKKVPQYEVDELLESPVHLFCFPYAGGDASIYSKWTSINGPQLVVKPVEYPGHGTKINERLLTSFNALINYLERTLINEISKGGSFAFFGHSLGALVSLELSFLLEKKYGILPEKLFLSACPPPNYIGESFEPICNTSGAEFKQALKKLNGTPSALLESDAFETFFLPILRNDFSLLGTYQHHSNMTRAPLVVMGGKQDPFVRIDDLKNWQEWTEAEIDFYEVEGDHFFVHQSNKITEIIKESLCTTPR